MFEIPSSWSASRLTKFSVFAASVGVRKYKLGVVLGPDSVPTRSVYRDVGDERLRMERRWMNVKEWAKDVFDGVETRVLPVKEDLTPRRRYRSGQDDWLGPRIVDYVDGVRCSEGFISQVLCMAQEGQDKGQSWSTVVEGMEGVWEDFLYHGPAGPREFE